MNEQRTFPFLEGLENRNGVLEKMKLESRMKIFYGGITEVLATSWMLFYYDYFQVGDLSSVLLVFSALIFVILFLTNSLGSSKKGSEPHSYEKTKNATPKRDPHA